MIIGLCCAVCHRELTAKQEELYEREVRPGNFVACEDPQHQEIVGYRNRRMDALQRIRRGEQVPLVFHVGYGPFLSTTIDEVWPHETWVNTPSEDMSANMQWEKVIVADEECKDAWIDARNACLTADWTPNQTDEEREENREVARHALAVMEALEIKASWLPEKKEVSHEA